MTTTLNFLNTATHDDFVRVCGPLFEHSRWIAERWPFKRVRYADRLG